VTDVTSGEETAYHSGATEFIPFVCVLLSLLMLKSTTPKIKTMIGLGAVRDKIVPTSDVDKIFSKMYS
jgi:hypothetical protein